MNSVARLVGSLFAKSTAGNASVTFVQSRSLFAASDKILEKQFRKLPIPDHVQLATYVWIDGTGERTRSKIRTVDRDACDPKDYPNWHYDGSSTGQAEGGNSDMTLQPVRVCTDPFFGKPHTFVLCEVYDDKGFPTRTNHRAECVKSLEAVKHLEPWFGMEQEYTLLGQNGRPLGWPDIGFPAAQGPYYCAHGSHRSFGRDISNSHLFACLHAGLAVAGTNGEVMPGQWEYQVGPCGGLEMSDELWLARHILERICEEFGADVTIDPKPVEGDWNGAGNHCNFSTKPMREQGGLEVIKEAMPKLEKRHMEHIRAYDPNDGEDNKRRLTGLHETAPIDRFSWGIGSRAVSIRVPRPVGEKGLGWFEDRRPSANCDPYLVVDRMIKTVCLDM